jgi:sulfur-oxidizing protein SoxY
MCAWCEALNSIGSEKIMTTAFQQRREILARGSVFYALLSCGLLSNKAARASEVKLAFAATSLDEALRAMTMGSIQVATQEIVLTIPDVVENGAFVPVTVSSSLPRTQEISLVVESNPYPLVVQFTIAEGTEAFVSTRIKMAGSGRVYALIKADNKVYSSFKQTSVTIGGCG